MYIAAPSQEVMYDWMAALRQGKGLGMHHKCNYYSFAFH